MDNICNYNSCTGCLACYNVCGVQAISLHSDSEGFVHPLINKSVCVDCKECQRVCPVNNSTLNEKPLRIFSGWNRNNEIRKRSSSGGVFTSIASLVLENGGVVFGAALDKELRVVHTSIDKIDDLNIFQGSKYVQSNIGLTFKNVKKLLKEGKTVLYSGTPCQISGLNNFLKKYYSNLITVDIVCHGVPSPLIFEEYKEYIKDYIGHNLRDINFRSKIADWRYFSMVVNRHVDEKKHGYEYIGGYYDDPFIRGFLRNLYLRPSCHECRFCSIMRTGDITLADWWGYRKERKEDKDFKKLGVSLIMANTPKGLKLIEEANLQIRERTIQEAKDTNRSLSGSFPPSEKREAFWNDYHSLGFRYVLKKYLYPENLDFAEKIRYRYPHSIIMEYIAKAYGLFRRINNYIAK